MRKLLSVFGLVLSLATATAYGAQTVPETRDPMSHFFVQSFGNLHEEAAIAKSEGKRGILVMFNDPECPWCAKMKANVLNQVRVQEYYRKYFRPLHVDTRGDAPLIDFSGKEWTEKDWAFKVNRVRATPVFVFYGLDGKPVMRYTGATRGIEEFLWLGEFVANGEYKNKNFTVYKRERLAAKTN